MSVFKRLRDLTMSNVYSLIEKAEDPVKMTDQYLRDMQADVQEAGCKFQGGDHREDAQEP